MTYRFLRLAIVIAATAIAGCSLFERDKRPAETPRVGLRADGSPQSVNPDPMVFLQKGKKTIVWDLPAGSTATFDPKRGIDIADGIVLPENVSHNQAREKRNPDWPVARAADEFQNCRAIENGRKFTCDNLHTKKALFKYTVRLLNKDGKPLDPLDPDIYNH